MKKWKQKISFLTRLKFAWKAFWLQSMEIENWQPYQVQTNFSNLREWPCDIHECENKYSQCLSRTDLFLRVETEKIDHLHVCATHANQITGKTEPYGGFDRHGI